MNGMDMMLKSFGIDPEKIKQQFQETASQVIQKVDEIHTSQTRIELKLDLLISVLRESGQLPAGNLDTMRHVENESDHPTENVLTGAFDNA